MSAAFFVTSSTHPSLEMAFTHPQEALCLRSVKRLITVLRPNLAFIESKLNLETQKETQ